MSYHGMNGLGFTLSPQMIIAAQQQQQPSALTQSLMLNRTPTVAPLTGSALLTRLHTAPAVVGPPDAPPVVEDVFVEEEIIAPEEVATSFIADEYVTDPGEGVLPLTTEPAAAEEKKLPWLWIILAATGLGGAAWWIMRK